MTSLSQQRFYYQLSAPIIPACFCPYERFRTTHMPFGFRVHRSSKCFLINQHKYTKDLVAMAQLENSSFLDTPFQLNVKYQWYDGYLFDPIVYKKLVGSLVFLNITCLDISHAVNIMTKLRHLHLAAFKWAFSIFLGLQSIEFFPYWIRSLPKYVLWC